MRGTGRVTKRVIAFVLSFIMVAGTFMTDYTIARASEEVEEITPDAGETSEAEVSEETEAEEETETTEEEVVEEPETTEEEVVEEPETTEEEVVEEPETTEEEVVEETEITEDEELLDEAGFLDEELLDEEIIEIVEEMIEISFEASKGGSVSMSKQELGEEDEVEAVTATADEGYEFVNWTKDGEEVSTSEEFTPAKEEATYVANFEEVEEEELEFNQFVERDGVKISLYAKPGVLPNDAELQAEKVSAELEKEIKEAIDSETEGTVEKTISFDINIYSASAGGYVQPEDGTVSVTFELLGVDTKDKEVSVYHVKENGSSVSGVEEVAAPVANTDEVTFEAEHFSVYTASVASETEPTTSTVYVYVMDDGWENNTEKEDQIGLHEKDSNGFYPVGVVEIPNRFFEGKTNPYLQDYDTWKDLRDNVLETGLKTGIDEFTDEPFKTANGNNHVKNYLDNVNTDQYSTAGSGRTSLFDWNADEWASWGFTGRPNTNYHLDLRLEVRTVTFLNGNNDIPEEAWEAVQEADEEWDRVTLGSRGYFEKEAVTKPESNAYDVYIKIPEGYKIAGYYTDADFGTPYVFGQPITEDHNVYVKYEEEKNEYTVTFNYKTANGEDVTTAGTYSYGDILSKPKVDEYYTDADGNTYKFKGWSKEGSDAIVSVPVMVTETVTYNAVYEQVVFVEYHSNYPVDMPNEETDPEAETLGSYTVEDLPEEWTVDGYTFAGWTVDIGDTSVLYQPEDNYTLEADTIFYAVWEEKQETPEGDDQTPGGETPGGETPDDETPGNNETPDGGNQGGGNQGGGSSDRDDDDDRDRGRDRDEEGRVLGARREDIAIIAEEGQVLGAVRAPKTDDASRAILWMLVMGTSAIGAAVTLAGKKQED